MQKAGKKIASIVTTLALSIIFLAASATKASANEGSNYSSHHGSGSYGSGFQLMLMPSVDYYKTAFTQGFNYQNDVNFANHTTLAYGANQSTESFNQGYFQNNLKYHDSGDSMNPGWGLNAMFMWLSGLLDGHNIMDMIMPMVH